MRGWVIDDLNNVFCIEESAIQMCPFFESAYGSITYRDMVVDRLCPTIEIYWLYKLTVTWL